MSRDGTRENTDPDTKDLKSDDNKVAAAPEKDAAAPEKDAAAPEKDAAAPEKFRAAPEKYRGAKGALDGSSDHYDSDGDRKRRRKSRGLGDPVFCRPLEVVVRDDRVEQAIRQLKNRMAREGVLRELKNRRHYFKPSELKRIKSREAARRRRKQARQKGAN